MALISASTARVRKLATTSFADAMGAQRTWLDANKIQPTLFKYDHTLPDAIHFEISFETGHEATAFDTEFRN